MACSQDHKKIQAQAQPDIRCWCGVCGIELSKKVTQAILATKEAAK